MSGAGLSGHRASQIAVVIADTAASDPQRVPAGVDAVVELRALRQAYVRLLESGRDRIRDLGGDCDPVDVMERGDSDLRRADAAIAELGEKGEPAAWKSPFGACVCNGENVCPGCNPNEAIELAAEIATADERRKHPPCLECGATSAKDAETKCACSGDKDDCHGCELWPDGDDEIPNAPVKVPGPSLQVDPDWSQHDRIEFALRDAGFDLDDASRVASAAEQRPAGADEAMVERAAKGLWEAQAGAHAMLESQGAPVDWESQPEGLKRDFFRQASATLAAAAVVSDQSALDAAGVTVWLREKDVADLAAEKPWTDGAQGVFSQRRTEEFTVPLGAGHASESGRDERVTTRKRSGPDG